MSWAGATLLYRATCAKCRGLSLAVVWLSLGWVRRAPLSSPEATRLHEEHGVRPGKLALVGSQRMFSGWRVVPGIPVLLLFALLSTLHRPSP